MEGREGGREKSFAKLNFFPFLLFFVLFLPPVASVPPQRRKGLFGPTDGVGTLLFWGGGHVRPTRWSKSELRKSGEGVEGGGRERRAIADSHRGRKGLPSSESSPSQHPLSQKCLEKPIKILFLPLPPSSTSFIRSAPNPFSPSAHATNPFLHCHSSPALDLPPQPTPGKSRKQRWAPNLLSLLLSPPSRYISSRNYLLFSESSEHERGSEQEGGEPLQNCSAYLPSRLPT